MEVSGRDLPVGMVVIVGTKREGESPDEPNGRANLSVSRKEWDAGRGTRDDKKRLGRSLALPEPEPKER